MSFFVPLIYTSLPSSEHWFGLSPASPQGTWWAKGLSPAGLQGAWGSKRTESRQSTGTWGPKGPSPASPQGTRGEDWTCTGLVLYTLCLSAHRYFVCIYIPWRPSTGGLARKNVQKVDVYLYLFVLFIKKEINQVECLEYFEVLCMCWIWCVLITVYES